MDVIKNDRQNYKRRVRDKFNRVAPTYSRYAHLQRALAGRLINLAPPISPRRVMDVGAGSGYLGAQLVRAFPHSCLINLDISHGMLRQCENGRENDMSVCADMENIPFADACFDVVASNAALHWNGDSALSDMRRVVKKGGYLLIALMANGTLSGLAQSWRAVDDADHVMHFPTLCQFSARAQTCGFKIEQIHHQNELVLYESVDALFKTLQKTGVTYRGEPAATSRHGEYGLGYRSLLNAVKEHYAQHFSWRDKVYAHYEMILCCARAV